jgi:steroid delta-isomerase-like uncharacterized protein
MTQSNADQYLSAGFKAWNEHNPQLFTNLFTDEGSFKDPSLDEPLSGSEIADYLRKSVAAYPDLQLARQMTITSGDSGAVEWVFTGTNEGSFEGIPPTGKEVELRGSTIVRCSLDGIRYWRDYWDSQELARQLGLD